MSRYVIFKPATGEILRTVSCPHSMIALQISTDEDYREELDISVTDESAYIDADQVVRKPQRPSDNHVFDYATKQWKDPRTLADFKTAKWKEIKRARTDAEEGGFVWDGSTFDSDEVSQRRIGDAVTMAGIVPNFTIDWTLADNTVRTLSATDMVAVGLTLAQHVDTQHQHSRTLRTQINAATTIAEVEAINW